MKNPAKLLQLKKQYSAFLDRHPKFMRYLAYITDHYMEEGAVLDVTVTDAAGKSLHGNAKLSAEDVAFLQEVRRMLGGE
ncbi:MAG: hypothetical protein IKQ04_01040 [Oscillospiraceae bacterium]|nr:hypothetical protein [Oscillospiraceae bacterium]